MTLLFTVWLGVVLILVIVALIYRSIAFKYKTEADRQRQRAEDAEAISHHRRQLDTALKTLHETHREETIHANDPTHLAGRTDFDNNWSDSERLRDAGAAQDDHAGAAAAGTTGTAGHQVDRDDMLGR